MVEIISAEEAREKSLYTYDVQKILENLNDRILGACARHARICVVNFESTNLNPTWEDMEAVLVILESVGYVATYIDGVLTITW